MSGEVAALRAGYLDRSRNPAREIERLLEGWGDPARASIWITRIEPGALRVRAGALESLAARDRGAIERLPLWGVPFAVKDNIDVAGLPTTAACPAFAYTPLRSATVVERLEAAGAILVGKTNLDQFATGLSGTRSPYGVVPNAFDPRFIAGGSSSGSAVGVARGLVSFALGTDTAGSGRVPAGMNNLVGLKPTRGLISARGVVPACRSLDCVSVFALTVPDAVSVLDVLRGFDAEDLYSRSLSFSPERFPPRYRFGIPRPADLEFYGDTHARSAFESAIGLLRSLGGEPVAVDFSAFREAAALLYEGPWVAERLAAIRPFYDAHATEMHPVVREIIGGAARWSAADLFAALAKLESLKRQTADLWDTIAALVVPTVPAAYTIDQLLAEPIALNGRLGHYTNFVNLLDLAALAVPATMRPDGLPAGITLIHRAGSDLALAALGERVQRAAGLPLGATGAL